MWGARELHLLCCLPAAGDRSPPSPPPPQPPSVAGGLLYKWTNIGKGWRPRWFAIRGAVLAYSKIRRRSRTVGTPICFVHLKSSSFRASESDDRRFDIITPTKTLQLRTDSAEDRVAWIQALVSACAESSQSDQNGAPFSTSRLGGLDEEIVSHIVHSEFSQYHAHTKQLSEQYLSFPGCPPQEREEDGCHFYDTRESFGDSAEGPDLKMERTASCKDTCLCVDKYLEPRAGKGNGVCMPLCLKQRTKLPEPIQKEKSISLWSLIKDNVGKDLTRACLPVYFNGPLSALQKCFV